MWSSYRRATTGAGERPTVSCVFGPLPVGTSDTITYRGEDMSNADFAADVRGPDDTPWPVKNDDETNEHMGADAASDAGEAPAEDS
ncbi:MAG: hypothetical protein JWL70_1631 [Acidimicrobiia bacterium]|nr:hypothetical protein [Acidimicrobiia bacterium]